jgi:hypothetical protein
MERLAALENEMRAEEKEALELLLTKVSTPPECDLASSVHIA